MKFNVSSPTPTTVAFTVSTRASLKTVSARLLFFLSVLARMLLGASAILAIWLRWRWSAQAGHRRAHPDGRQYILPFYGDAGTWTGHTILYLTADWLVEQIQLRYLVLVSALALWLAVQRGHTGKSLTPGAVRQKKLSSHHTALCISTVELLLPLLSMARASALLF